MSFDEAHRQRLTLLKAARVAQRDPVRLVGLVSACDGRSEALAAIRKAYGVGEHESLAMLETAFERLTKEAVLRVEAEIAALERELGG